MDHQVLGTREDGERTYSYQVIADRSSLAAGIVGAELTQRKGRKEELPLAGGT